MMLMLNEDQLEWIERYLNHELTTEQHKAFNKKLQEDPLFAIEMQEYIDARNIQNHPEYEKLKAQIKAIKPDDTIEWPFEDDE